MPDPILIGKAFAVAAALALMVTLLSRTVGRGGVGSAVGALAVLCAVFVGLWVLGLLPQVPPREAFDRLLVIVLPAAAAAEVVASAWPRVGWLARCLVGALAAPLLLYGSSYVTDLSGPGSREWSPAQTWATCAALAVVLAGAWAAMIRLAGRTGGRTPLWCLAAAALGAAVAVILSGYATGGQLGFPLGAGLGGVALGSLVGRARHGTEGALGIGVIGLFGLLLVGRLFAGLTTVNAALLFIAPLLGWLPELLPARRGIRPALRLTLAAAAVVAALLLAHRQFAADSARPGSPTQGSLDDYTNFGK